MRSGENVKFTVSILVFGFTLGTALIAYAHANFTSKEAMSLVLEAVNRVETKVNTIDQRIYEMQRQ